MTQAKELRTLLEQQNFIVAPGAYDCITAKGVEQAGFSVAYVSGAGTAASMAGLPDYGLLTMTEMVSNAGRIASAVNLPVIADADTGYGNALNVVRTVHEYEKQGVAGVHIEDQSFPKKCGHLDNKEVIDVKEFVSKIQAAVNERYDDDFVIIARTDSRAVHGFEAAIERAQAAAEAGADLIFLEAPQTIEEIQAVPRRIKAHCVLNMAQGGKTPVISFQQAESFGYKLAIIPGILMTTVMAACDDVLRGIKKDRVLPPLPSGLTIKEKFRRFGSDGWDELTKRYSQ